jgi:hypothetical protein
MNIQLRLSRTFTPNLRALRSLRTHPCIRLKFEVIRLTSKARKIEEPSRRITDIHVIDIHILQTLKLLENYTIQRFVIQHTDEMLNRESILGIRPYFEDS